MSFPRLAEFAQKDALVLPDQGPIESGGLGSQRLMLTGTLPCALNSALRGDHCTAVGSAPGASLDLTLTLTLPLNLTLP